MAAKPSLSRSWWSNKFISSLESFTEPNRLQRGRAYSSSYRLKSFDIDGGLVLARVRGSVNPYLGVTREPTYITSLEFCAISRAHWAAAIALIATKAGLISKLMMGEIPDNIEDSFRQLNLNLLPQGGSDCKATCSCPDYSNPCKHIAGLYYRVAQELDKNPFLLFQLRGLSREALLQELGKSPLGQALCGELTDQAAAALPVTSLYSRPVLTAAPWDLSVAEFWQGRPPGQSQLPSPAADMPPQDSPLAPARPDASPDPSQGAGVSAIAIKKQGDYPSFWQRDNSFIAAMEELYQRVRDRNQDILA
jgi:uncharacterized Zn finger protein